MSIEFTLLLLLALGLIATNVLFRGRIVKHIKRFQNNRIPAVPAAVFRKEIENKLQSEYPNHSSLINEAYRDVRNFIYLTAILIIAALVVILCF